MLMQPYCDHVRKRCAEQARPSIIQVAHPVSHQCYARTGESSKPGLPWVGDNEEPGSAFSLVVLNKCFTALRIILARSRAALQQAHADSVLCWVPCLLYLLMSLLALLHLAPQKKTHNAYAG